MKYKLICLDIDGTLLDSKKKLLPQVKESLQNASKAGIQIALISGRMPSGVNLVEKELGISCIKACNAGSYILAGDRCISSTYLPNHMIREVYQKIAVKRKLPLWIFREEDWLVTDVDEFIRNETVFVAYQPKVVDILELAESWEKEGKKPNKLLFAAEPKIIQDIYQEIKSLAWPEIDIACSADTFIEIFPKGISKGTAFETICRELDIDVSQTIAFGDHELDIPLIEAAGIGVAMGNSIPLLKEKADFITKTNDEAGVACALEHLLAD